jgi:tRNA (cytidine/uridine-2'-O-)-methyltransferase
MKSLNLENRINVVLVEPEIPQNTGNIARTCVAIGASLHLIRPLGFTLSQKAIRRSGLDYWERLDLHLYDGLNEFLNKTNQHKKLALITTKAQIPYSDYHYEDDPYLVFGKESAGLPEEFLIEYQLQCVRIPMMENERSLNLSNAVAIMGYEVLRQKNFEGLKRSGNLHRLQWVSKREESS